MTTLTDAEIQRIWCACTSIGNAAFALEFARALESRLAAGQPVAWMRADGEEGSISTMTVCISAKVKDLWLKANPAQVERYTIPLYPPPNAAAQESTAEADEAVASVAIGAPVAAAPDRPQEPQGDSSGKCLPNGLPFDAFGEPRTRYVRVSLDGNHCVMYPAEGDRYLNDAKAAGDESAYMVSNVYLSAREFDDLPEHEGF